jgi:predicted nucleotidyltransferase
MECAGWNFGSILRGDFNDDRSDVDALVEFIQQAADSFTNFVALKESLEAVIGKTASEHVSLPPHLLDELARVFARAALDQLLEESVAQEPTPPDESGDGCDSLPATPSRDISN